MAVGAAVGAGAVVVVVVTLALVDDAVPMAVKKDTSQWLMSMAVK